MLAVAKGKNCRTTKSRFVVLCRFPICGQNGLCFTPGRAGFHYRSCFQSKKRLDCRGAASAGRDGRTGGIFLFCQSVDFRNRGKKRQPVIIASLSSAVLAIGRPGLSTVGLGIKVDQGLKCTRSGCSIDYVHQQRGNPNYAITHFFAVSLPQPPVSSVPSQQLLTPLVRGQSD